MAAHSRLPARKVPSKSSRLSSKLAQILVYKEGDAITQLY